MNKIYGSLSHRTPIYRDSGFVFPDIAEAERAFKGEEPGRSIYSRYGNPNVSSVEDALAKMEGSSWALVTASGMAAIDTALSIFQPPAAGGAQLMFSELYGGTNLYIEKVLKSRRQVSVEYFDPTGEVYEIRDFERKLDEVNPSLVYLESISNPLLIVPAAREMVRIAKARGIVVVVDNTFGTPLLWRPLEDGADVVVHSATKYLAGHGNLTAGVVAGKDPDLFERAAEYRKLVGCVLSPDDAYRLETQMKTIDLRFRRQCENASRLAEKLSGSEFEAKVRRVLYPGLSTHPTYQQAKNLFGPRGCGGMISFELRGGRRACDQLVEALRKKGIPYVPTLGDLTSILMHPNTVFGDRYGDGMIRFSVGCEAYGDLEEAMLAALERVE